MGTIYFITRTFVEPENGKSCVLLNNVYLDLLKQYFHVVVVTPSYNAEDRLDADYIKIRHDSRIIYPYMEKIGLMEDYLDTWVDKTLKVLLEKVHNEDIVFATSGGELACIKIGSIVARRKGCKFVVNFRDPIDYSYIDNRKTCGFFHVSRENNITNYLSNADLVITSSDKFKEVLEEKYAFLRGKLINNYYGYIDECTEDINHSKQLRMRKGTGEKIRLVFGGSMNKPQGAEIFIHMLKKRNDIEIVYIGEANKKIKRAENMRNVTVLKSMSHDAYLQYVIENADIALVSLAAEPYKVCFPSKIFEYINLEIPILGALPDGDAKKVINEKGYGKAVEYGNIIGLDRSLEYILENYENIVKNIQRDKADWAMKKKINEVIGFLQKL